MLVSYYNTLLPVREPGASLRDAVAGIRGRTGYSCRSARLRAG